MGFLKRIFQHLLQRIPQFSLLLADTVDLFIIPWFMTQPPSLLAIMLYFWLIYRPDRISLTILFFQGCAHDLIAGDPVGLSGLLVIASIFFSSYIRPLLEGQSFLKGWIGCGAMLFGLMFFKQSCALLLLRQTLPLTPMIISVLLSMGLYPLLAMVLNRTLFHYGSVKT